MDKEALRMKVLLFGKNGQLGSELQCALTPHVDLTALNRASTDYCGDLSNLDGIARSIAAVKPDVIINAAAYTAVDKAESEPELASLINAKAPEVMALEAKRFGARLIHYSTDYVFDGAGSAPYKETDAAHPINVYGMSKKAGEDAILSSGCEHIILRTSWVYGAAGRNFVKTIIELAGSRETLNVVDDQMGAPTGAALLADCTKQILVDKSWASGLYHLTASGQASWYEFALLIVDTARSFGAALKLHPAAIRPIPSKDYPTPAKRPLNSRLDTSKFQETFGIRLPQWQNGVIAMLKQYYEKQL